MKDRIFKNWTFSRGIYFVVGSLVMIQAGMESQWILLLPGAYFASMGLFAFGCAAGNCSYEPKNIDIESNSLSKNSKESI